MNCFRLAPTLLVADGFEHREPHAAAVRQPAAEQHFDRLFHAIDQFGVEKGVGRIFRVGGRGALRQKRLPTPFGRDDQALDDGLAADFEDAVELGDAAGPDGMPGLHLLGRFQQLARFGQQPQPGKYVNKRRNTY